VARLGEPGDRQTRAMITAEQVIPLLLEACPSFQPLWNEHVKKYEEPLIYMALGDFARHLLALYQRRETEVFPKVARVIERLHVEGDDYVREAATIGLLEAIQNNWANNDADPEAFAHYLHRESARWWQSLNDFWSGKSKSVGEGL